MSPSAAQPCMQLTLHSNPRQHQPAYALITDGKSLQKVVLACWCHCTGAMGSNVCLGSLGTVDGVSAAPVQPHSIIFTRTWPPTAKRIQGSKSMFLWTVLRLILDSAMASPSPHSNRVKNSIQGDGAAFQVSRGTGHTQRTPVNGADFNQAAFPHRCCKMWYAVQDSCVLACGSVISIFLEQHVPTQSRELV